MTDRPDTLILAERARELIAHHAHFQGRAHAFEFECREDVLVIRGCVPTFYLKQLLQDALKHLPGVQRIENLVDVFAEASPAAFADSR
jgi:hypothetical protein